MKFALVNDQRHEAQPDLPGKCPTCNHPMIAKCGEKKIWHWAHRIRRVCDPWWENETEWHRGWKGQFPVTWQEVVHHAVDGEKHIADVKTDHGWVIEFQHSHIKPEERRSRDAFYKKIVWVVDGTRRKRDREQFITAWNYGAPIGSYSHVKRAFTHGCALLRDWADGHMPVFFDFGEANTLWWLLAKSDDGRAYIAQFSRNAFIETHTKSVFDALVNDISRSVADHESQLRRATCTGFDQYLAPRRAFRRRI